MTKFFVSHKDAGVGGATVIQKWMRDNRIKHGPTIKKFNGWEFDIIDIDDIDDVAFKLKWT